MSQLSSGINERLAFLSSASICPFIFKINEQLQRQNKKAYEPEILGVGPYYRKKVNLQMMEVHKLRYLDELLKRRNESVDRYLEALKNLEKEARNYYAEPIKLNKDKFVEMMLLDGCFIIELFRKFNNPTSRYEHDPIFQILNIRKSIRRDLLLFENQIPLFVLIQLIDMTENSNQGNPQDILARWALNFFRATISSFSRSQTSNNQPTTIPKYNDRHLLSLVHDAWYSLIAEKGNVIVIPLSSGTDKSHEFIKSVTELREAGIKFKKTECSSLLDVKFENGIMEIPPLRVDDDTEWLFRNLIAYEQYSGETGNTYMTDYMTFMDCLLNSPKDVEILRHSGIIDNWLGDDKVVSTMFNKMCNHILVNVDSETFYYRKVFKEVNEYCKHRRHGWMAFPRYNYCNSPWSILSVTVATVFLLLTVIQTGCSILQV
ncbi:unnamed protein product [Ilex paraguariensis]|uniref:Uncharacterized protein n=1 Tax=Ilex paraguariensis TaxID=185542 RepID=A0ABC8RN02_9AQUA